MEPFSKFFKSFRRYHRFHPLDSSSASDDELAGKYEEHLLMDERLKRKTVIFKSRIWILLTITNLIILGITVSMILTSHCQLYAGKNADLRPISWWSPILDAIEIPTYETTLNGTFFAKPEVSIAREEPGPENDADWEQYETIRTHIVSREDILRLGKDPDTVMRFDNDYWGFGDDAYMVQLDVMHQIHCLNMLRKAAFHDYPGYVPTGAHTDANNTHASRWTHLGHCVDILLQNIQCNANTEVITLAWVEGRTQPWPDFSVNRKCRDFEAIYKWQLENSVDAGKFDRMPIPHDAYVWPAPWENRESELGEKLGKHQKQEGVLGQAGHQHTKRHE
ncbi:Protein of unknown function DUF3328 [Aspergillus oryzae]|uniref:Tat pathway signal sequence n=1 Tax=Aspergillus oryzae TaxID=5062 RepID=A0A1S9DCY9_ASPOZ|nr:Protein of unknown function DUF3328 [Aspergillus oryzae]QMW47115.1 hypothetical protein G4B11_010594 [Aspergillus flavus]RAQ50901.1 hypothetical protein AFGD_003442 [Aspergillus flavus]